MLDFNSCFEAETAFTSPTCAFRCRSLLLFFVISSPPHYNMAHRTFFLPLTKHRGSICHDLRDGKFRIIGTIGHT